MVILGSAHVGVRRQCGDRCRCWQRLLIEMLFEDGHHALARRRTDRERAPAGGLEALLTIAARQMQQSQTRAIAHLRVGLVGELPVHDVAGGRTDRERPVQEPSGRPVEVFLVGLRHVFGNRGVRAFAVTTRMACHPFSLVQAFNGGGGEAHIEFALHQRVRHAVIMPVDLDVVIDADARLLPLGVFIRRGRQRLQGRAIEGLERAPPATGQLLERPGVEVLE